MNLARYFKRRRRDWELKQEMEHHLALEYDLNQSRGMDSQEARRRAHLKFGSRQKVHEEVWRHNSIFWLEKLIRDIRYCGRTLLRSPGYTIMAVLTLGLGIGANTAIFTVINGVLLRPLPYAAPEQIVHLQQAASRLGSDPISFSVQEVQDYREESHSFSDMAEYHSMTFTLLGAKVPSRVVTGVISANYFNILGAKPVLGRLFTANDETMSAPPVLVLSYAYWLKELGADPKVIGRPFVMNDRVHTVVGIMSPIPDYPDANDVYMPTTSCPFRSSAGMIANRDARVLSVFARLKPGVSAAQAQNDVATITRRLALAYPKSYPPGAGIAVRVVPLQQELTHAARSTFLVLLGAAGLVLLLACANLANLALSRQLRRSRETAIRLASGATTWDIFRQYLTESMMIAIGGGLLGLAIAAGGLKLLVAYAAGLTPLSEEIRLDGRVLFFAFCLSLVTGVLFGAIPGFVASRSKLASLAGSNDRAVGSETGTRTRNLLVAAQVAFSFVLLAGAGLMLRSLYNLLSVDTGFRTANVLSMNISLNWTKYSELSQQNAFFGQILERADQIPGVQAVAMSSVVPLNSERGGMNNGVIFEGHPPRPGEPLPQVSHQLVTADYFSLLGISLLSGRSFTDADTRDSAPVAIINAQMARHYWPKENPLGRRLSGDHGKTWVTIVGVVSNAHQFGLDQDFQDDVYFPQTQVTFMGDPKLLLRTREDPKRIVNQMVSLIHQVDPQQPVTDIRTLEELRSAQVGVPRVTATLLGVFAGLALFITVVGVTGTLGLAVSRRTKEIGIRIALGATRGQVLANVLAGGMRPVLMGVGVGAIAAVFCTGLLSSMLFAIRPNDPVTLIEIAALLCLMAFVGCLVPGRRAAQIDPNRALRTD